MPDKTIVDLSEAMRDIDFCLLTTIGERGGLRARPMSNNREVDFTGDCFFFTCGDTRKVADIERDPAVALGFQGKASLLGAPGIFISAEGRAELIRDKAAFAEHWVKDLDRWFEAGIDTPGLTLIKARAERIHYWDGADEGEIAL
ncbi:pyridoxamine 5'-phosphate oxidase family protein [Sphingomonas sp.]|uniref:pyridoxamine 5'-phosphate oxidase family protein n=1 Tax=Sphingomonas sp. TaxID=28214 RepID=UPI00286D9C77|nr:pyridoxamine 5'-phosphate oxidase family protein [Sphingomonas sp.]